MLSHPEDDNKVFEKSLAKAKNDVLQGTQLSVALQSDYMPAMATSLISIGEKTGAFGVLGALVCP